MRFGCGSDVVWTWLGRGSEVVRRWVGGGSDVFSDLVSFHVELRNGLRELAVFAER